MRRWKLSFEYNGSGFSGWQKQPDARTVEGEIEKALSIYYQREIDIAGQGRTDAGVHARAQIAHADLPEEEKTTNLVHALRGLLPEDVALVSMEPVNDEFHARFNATSRTYSYHLMERYSPLERDRVWCCGYNLEIPVLEKLAESVKGDHDFINFCIPGENEEQTTRSEITESHWERSDELLKYRIRGNRFLRHMVRRLVGTMVKTATGRMSENRFQELLHGKESAKKGHSAPAHGLYLESVSYK